MYHKIIIASDLSKRFLNIIKIRRNLIVFKRFCSGLHLRVTFVICRLYHGFRTVVVVKSSYNRFVIVNRRDAMVFYLKTSYDYTFVIVL